MFADRPELMLVQQSRPLLDDRQMPALSYLREYQREYFERFKNEWGSLCLFAPGLGKTATSLAIAQYKWARGEIDHVLVIAPNGVHRQWAEQECRKWVEVPCEVICNGRRVYSTAARRQQHLMIFCVNIDKFSYQTTSAAYIYLFKPTTLVILDEATKIKSPKAARTKRLVALRNISPVMCLTGTPVTNSISDLWSILTFCGFIEMTYYQFLHKYCILIRIADVPNIPLQPITRDIYFKIARCSSWMAARQLWNVSGDDYLFIKEHADRFTPSRHLDELLEIVDAHGMRLAIDQVLDMPEKQYIRVPIELDKKTREQYNTMKKDFICQLDDGEFMTRASALAALMALRQITSWGTKRERIVSDVEEMDTAIIFCQFTKDIEWFCDHIPNARRLDGSKKEVFEPGTICVAQYAVASMGYNFQFSHIEIFCTPTYSYETRVQAEGRIWRSGQQNRCIYYDYIATNTCDEKALDALAAKKSIASIFQGGDVDDEFLDSIRELV